MMKKIIEYLSALIALVLLCGCCCLSIPPSGGINSTLNKNNTPITSDANILNTSQKLRKENVTSYKR